MGFLYQNNEINNEANISYNIFSQDERIAKKLNIPTFVIDSPKLASIRGAGALLEDTNLLEWLGEAR